MFFVDVPVQLHLGHKKNFSTYSGHIKSGFYTGESKSPSFNYMKVFAEDDIYVLSKSSHGFNLKLAINVPFGYVARVETSPNIQEGVSIVGDFVHSQSRNRSFKGYVCNNNPYPIRIYEKAVLGHLVIKKLSEEPLSYTATLLETKSLPYQTRYGDMRHI